MIPAPPSSAPLIAPFRGLRPTAETAADVIAPPDEVMAGVEACALVTGRPRGMPYPLRAEVDSPAQIPGAAALYDQAATRLARLRAAGLLRRDQRPGYYVYRLSRGEQVQTGLVAAASLAAYRCGRIRRHEVTLAAVEDDRVRQIERLNAQTGPALLIHRRSAAIDDSLAEIARTEPTVDCATVNGVRHALWVVDRPADIARLTAAFEAQPRLYIADGHHRTAAAARIADARRRRDATAGADACDDRFLAVSFPADALRILAVHRLVSDLNGHDSAAFLRQVGERFAVTRARAPVQPARRGEFGLYLERTWYRLHLDRRRIAAAPMPDDPAAGLDVRLLQDRLLAPILGIDDPRRDPRLGFVGGIRGLAGLVRPVDRGAMRAAFSLHPPSLAELLAVADAGATMPPKCTWCEIKSADGLVSLLLDGQNAVR